MPREWNTRSIVEVPEVLVWGLLHASERPTLAGSAAFSRSILSNSSRLSSGERPGPPRNGLIWACAAADRRTKAANAADKQRGDRDSIRRSAFFSVSPGPDKPITAALDLVVHRVDEFGVGREAADQIGEHICDRDRSDRQHVGARG